MTVCATLSPTSPSAAAAAAAAKGWHSWRFDSPAGAKSGVSGTLRCESRRSWRERNLIAPATVAEAILSTRNDEVEAMSHIPNNAIPHAQANDGAEAAPKKKKGGGGARARVGDAVGGAVERVVEAARDNPRTAIAAGVAVAGAMVAAGVAAARGRGKSGGSAKSGGAAKPAGASKSSGTGAAKAGGAAKASGASRAKPKS
jgi:hypothetical protein